MTITMPPGAMDETSAARGIPRLIPAAAPGLPDCYVANARPGQQVLVAVHGISRNAAELASRFAAHPGFRDTTIVAPLFDRARFGKYQQLRAGGSDGVAADAALIDLLDSLAAEHGIAAAPFLLFGFSGGAQMAHRFAMLHPRRVARLCLASAGWYTMPTPALAWPYGLQRRPGESAIGEGFLDIPTTVIVGNRDVRVDASVRQDPVIVEHQGRNRLRRARIWVRSVNARAAETGRMPRHVLVTMPDGTHDFSQAAREAGLPGLVARALL